MRAAAISLLIVASGAAYAQQTGNQRPVFGADVSLVMVNVSVVDREGLPVTGLGPGDFVVIEDGVERDIAVVLTPAESPADIGLLMDLSGSVRSDEVALRRDALAFIDALRPDDCVYFLPFAAEIGAGTWGRPDDAELRDAIQSTRVHGYTPLYDAVLQGINRIEHAIDRCGTDPLQERRRALVVITDGGDTSSQASFAAAINAASMAELPIFTVAIGVAITEGQNANIGAGGQQVIDTRADARRKSVAAGNADPVAERVHEFDHVTRAAQQSAQQRWDQRMYSYGLGLAESLQEIATISGGKYIDGGESNTELAVAYRELLNWLRSSYVVGYYSTPVVRSGDHRGRAVWREIEVQTINEENRVYARPGRFDSDIDREAAAEAVRAGIELLQVNNTDDAIIAFTRALDADPFNWEAHYYRGRALGVQGRIVDARDEFLAAADLGPGYGPVHEFVAIASADLGDTDTAWEHAIRAQHAGYDMSQRFAALRELSPAPDDLQQRLEVPRLYVGPAVVPDPEAQATLEALLRAMRRAISDAREFALVVEPELADYRLRLRIDDLGGDQSGAVDGKMELLTGEGAPLHEQDLSLHDVFDRARTDARLADQLDRLDDWLRSRR